MKKILKMSLLLVVVIIFCTACDGDVTRALRHDGFNLNGDIVCDAFFGENATERIRYLTGDRIITTEGKIYEVSLGQNYSNNQNCRAADTSLRVSAIMDDKVFKATDGNFYTLVNENNTAAYTQISSSDNSYVIYELLLKPEGTIKAMTADSNNGIFYVLKSDGNVYGITITKANSNAAPSIVGSNIVYNSTDYGGTIVDFNYNGDSGSTFVRTDLKVYRMKAINVEECSKFADVACSYQMMESTVFEENRDYIVAYNGSTVITSYKKVFTVGS